jgi:hypothetical protein
MPAELSFDVAAAHKYFAAHCCNAAWDLIDKPTRTPEEERPMVALNQASICRWQNRSDCTNENLSVGYWQASRIHALRGNAGEATRHAEVCLSDSAGLEPFYVGYAYEAFARAASLAGNRQKVAEYLSLALTQAEAVKNAKHRAPLANDLARLNT